MPPRRRVHYATNQEPTTTTHMREEEAHRTHNTLAQANVHRNLVMEICIALGNFALRTSRVIILLRMVYIRIYLYIDFVHL